MSKVSLNIIHFSEFKQSGGSRTKPMIDETMFHSLDCAWGRISLGANTRHHYQTSGPTPTSRLWGSGNRTKSHVRRYSSPNITVFNISSGSNHCSPSLCTDLNALQWMYKPDLWFMCKFVLDTNPIAPLWWLWWWVHRVHSQVSGFHQSFWSQRYHGMQSSGSNSRPLSGGCVAAETWPSPAMVPHYFNKNQCLQRAFWEGRSTCLYNYMRQREEQRRDNDCWSFIYLTIIHYLLFVLHIYTLSLCFISVQ